MLRSVGTVSIQSHYYHIPSKVLRQLQAEEPAAPATKQLPLSWKHTQQKTHEKAHRSCFVRRIVRTKKRITLTSLKTVSAFLFTTILFLLQLRVGSSNASNKNTPPCQNLRDNRSPVQISGKQPIFETIKTRWEIHPIDHHQDPCLWSWLERRFLNFYLRGHFGPSGIPPPRQSTPALLSRSYPPKRTWSQEYEFKKEKNSSFKLQVGVNGRAFNVHVDSCWAMIGSYMIQEWRQDESTIGEWTSIECVDGRM